MLASKDKLLEKDWVLIEQALSDSMTKNTRMVLETEKFRGNVFMDEARIEALIGDYQFRVDQAKALRERVRQGAR